MRSVCWRAPVRSDSKRTATQPGLPLSWRRERTGELVQRILDNLPVTDTVFHHLAFTRPLVDALVEAVRAARSSGRVLVIGANDLLPQALIQLGYDVELWIISGLPLSRSNHRQGSSQGTIDEVLQWKQGEKFDIVVAPYAAEAAKQELGEVLGTLSDRVRAGGHIILASRQPGELRRRVRATLRLAGLETRPDPIFPPSP